MNQDNFSNEKFRPTYTDDRARYRFEDYESDPMQHQPQPATAYQPNYAAQQNFNPDFDSAKDEKQLDQLSLGFKVYAGINALFSSFPIFHLIIGIMIVSGAMDGGKDAPPEFFGWFFIIFASVFMTFGYAVSICNYYAGHFLKERRNYTFCFVMSCVNCTFMPLGTILGIFGILVLVRDSVKDVFRKNSEETLPG